MKTEIGKHKFKKKEIYKYLCFYIIINYFYIIINLLIYK